MFIKNRDGKKLDVCLSRRLHADLEDVQLAKLRFAILAQELGIDTRVRLSDDIQSKHRAKFCVLDQGCVPIAFSTIQSREIFGYVSF